MNRRREPGVTRALKFAEVLKVKVEDIDWPGAVASPAPMPAGETRQVMPEQGATAKVWAGQGATKAEVTKTLGISRTFLYSRLGKQ